MRFSKQEYWSGFPFPSPGDFPNPGIEPASPVFPAEPSGKLTNWSEAQVTTWTCNVEIGSEAGSGDSLVPWQERLTPERQCQIWIELYDRVGVRVGALLSMVVAGGGEGTHAWYQSIVYGNKGKPQGVFLRQGGRPQSSYQGTVSAYISELSYSHWWE